MYKEVTPISTIAVLIETSCLLHDYMLAVFIAPSKWSPLSRSPSPSPPPSPFFITFHFFLSLLLFKLLWLLVLISLIKFLSYVCFQLLSFVIIAVDISFIIVIIIIYHLYCFADASNLSDTEESAEKENIHSEKKISKLVVYILCLFWLCVCLSLSLVPVSIFVALFFLLSFYFTHSLSFC